MVDNTKIRPRKYKQDYIEIQRQRLVAFRGGNRYCCTLAISKKDGGIYLMGFKDSGWEEVVKILRFKDLERAKMYTTWMHITTDNLEEMTDEESRLQFEVIEALHRIIEGYKMEGTENDVEIIRDAVLNGEPNGKYIPCRNIGLWDAVAKQPKLT